VTTPVQLADAHRRAGRLGQAEQLCRELLAREPNNADAHHLLAVVHLERGDAASAAALAERASALDPRNAEARNTQGVALQRLGRNADALPRFEAAIRLAPAYPEAYYNRGLALAGLGRDAEARAMFRRSLELRPGYADPQYQLLRLYRRAIPRWHFPMLNDEPRNVAYDEVIRAAVGPRDVVLDIGTGSGLLAMMAARAGAEHVYACESVELMAQKAAELVEANGFAGKVSVMARNSRQLQVGRDLPRRADVLVTEIFDAALLGEDVQATLADALERLLAEGARIVPHMARIHCALLSSEELWQHYRVSRAAGFDLAALNEFAAEPYYQVDLAGARHELLSEPIEIAALALAKVREWPARLAQTLTVKRAGLCHALCFWFDLDLDAKGKVKLTNSPLPSRHRKAGHWGQCIQLLDPPLAVKRRQRIAVQAQNRGKLLSFSLEPG
jgi:precorrin-6B methylase 2